MTKKKNFIQKVFTLPYDTLDVYKKLKKRTKITSSVNEQSLGHK